MRKMIFSIAGLAVLLAATALLAGCYAPLANQNGYLGLQVTGRSGPGATSEVVVLVINADYESSLREMLWLIDKGKAVGLSGSEADRLISLAKQVATNGLVKFGGFPFFQTTISGTGPDQFDIPGVPAGRSYLVKVFVFDPGFSFKVENIDANFGNLINLQNAVYNSESYLTPLANWVLKLGQPVPVSAGQSTSLTMTLN